MSRIISSIASCANNVSVRKPRDSRPWASCAQNKFLGLFMLASAVASGCSQNSPPPPTPETAVTAPLLTEDEKFLLAMDYYDPMYKLDAEGHIIRLHLTNRHVPTAVMAEVGKLTHLKGLDCYGSTVTDDGIAQLKNLKNLHSIGLGATRITDKSLEYFENMPSLQWIWVPRIPRLNLPSTN